MKSRLKVNLLHIAVLCFMASWFVGCTAQKSETPQGAVIDSGFARAEIQLAHMLDTVAKYRTDSKFFPDDLIPYWDFDDPEIPNTYRDASAGAIIASALLSLSEMATPEKADRYKTAAIKMLQSLSSANYLAQPGTNNGFILKHSVGSIPHDNEIDVPLVYADYYYLEALLKYRATLNGGTD